MHPYDNPLIRNHRLDRLVTGGRKAIVDYLMDWTPQSIGKRPKRAFESALSTLKEGWFYEAVRVAGIVRNTDEAMPQATEDEQQHAFQKALEEVSWHFDAAMADQKHNILREAQGRLKGRADRVRIRVFRDRIEIVDLYPNQEFYPHDQHRTAR